MKLLSINDMRVVVALNKVEAIAEKIEATVTYDKCDILLERLFAITRPLRQRNGVDRTAFAKIDAFLRNTSVEKFIMTNLEA